MALLRYEFFSDVLEVGTAVNVVWPQVTEHQIGVAGGASGDGGVPVLYLLHGLSDDHTVWARNTSIERYAVARGVAVVMPAVHHSFYTDERHGHPYWTYVSDELPRIVGSTLKVSQRREDTFVAGLSMGGYGAFKWALRQPERFAAAASMSGALDIGLLMRRPDRRDLARRVFGEDGPGVEDDLFALLSAADAGTLPPLHVSCGTEDELIEGNQKFAQLAAEAGADVSVDWRPGEHAWDFWDAEIQTVLDWLPLDR